MVVETCFDAKYGRKKLCAYSYLVINIEVIILAWLMIE